MNKMEELENKVKEFYKEMDGLENGILITKDMAGLMSYKAIHSDIEAFSKVHKAYMPSIVNYVDSKIKDNAKLKKYFVEIEIDELKKLVSNDIDKSHLFGLFDRLQNLLVTKGYNVEILGADKKTEYTSFCYNFDEFKYLHIEWLNLEVK